jgi:hypothetical protein
MASLAIPTVLTPYSTVIPVLPLASGSPQIGLAVDPPHHRRLSNQAPDLSYLWIRLGIEARLKYSSPGRLAKTADGNQLNQPTSLNQPNQPNQPNPANPANPANPGLVHSLGGD